MCCLPPFGLEPIKPAATSNFQFPKKKTEMVKMAGARPEFLIASIALLVPISIGPLPQRGRPNLLHRSG